MINKIQNSFSIQDLEVLSGIKAHTIRIWEKRYSFLNPTRINRNVRKYGLLDLQKMLNASLLQNHNYKISELAKLPDAELANRAKSVCLERFSSSYHINTLIVSMFSLDTELFEEVYFEQIKKLSFSQIFIETYLPLLNHIGILWQTNGIKPANEHFISNLIYQKIALNIADIPFNKTNSKKVNLLFLPEGEVHELGLMYMSYHLKSIGNRVIYLGRDVPTYDLVDINSQFKEINWICYFLIDRTQEEKIEFINEIENLLKHTNNTCQIIGNIWGNYSSTNDRIIIHTGFDEFIKVI